MFVFDRETADKAWKNLQVTQARTKLVFNILNTCNAKSHKGVIVIQERFDKWMLLELGYRRLESLILNEMFLPIDARQIVSSQFNEEAICEAGCIDICSELEMYGVKVESISFFNDTVQLYITGGSK